MAEVATEQPTPEPTAEPTPEPTATPEPPTATPTDVPPDPTWTPTPVVAAAIAEPTAPAPTPVPTDEPTVPVGEAIISAAPLPVPNPIILLGTLLLALAAAAGQVFRNDPNVLRRLLHGFDGVRGRPAYATSGSGAGPEPFDQDAHQTSGRIDAYQTLDGSASSTYPGLTQADALHEYANASTLSGDQTAGGLGGQVGGAEAWSNGATDALAKSAGHGPPANGFGQANGFEQANGIAQANGFEQVNGFDGSHPGSADPSMGQDLPKQAVGQGASSPADAVGQHGTKIADLNGGGSGSDAFSKAHSGGSFGGSTGDASFAKGPVGAGSEMAHSGLGGSSQGVGSGADLAHGGLGGTTDGIGGAQGGLGGSAGSDALARPSFGAGNVLASGAEGAGQAIGDGGLIAPDAPGQVASSGAGPSADGIGGDLGSSGLGGSQGFGQGGDTLAKSLTPPVDPAQAAPPLGGTDGVVQASIDVDPGLSQSLDDLARSLPPVDEATSAGSTDGISLASPEPVGVVAGGFGPAWLAAGALARATLPDPLQRTVRCPACDRSLALPSRFCGYCGEPLDKTLA